MAGDPSPQVNRGSYTLVLSQVESASSTAQGEAYTAHGTLDATLIPSGPDQSRSDPPLQLHYEF